jgi:hypothetical protein
MSFGDGAGTVFSTAVSTSKQYTTTSTVQVQLNDAFGRHHSWTSTSVVPDNALHTAIVMAASVSS